MIRVEVGIVEVIGGTLKLETGHMTKAEIEMILEDLGGLEERLNLEIDMGLTQGIDVRREGVITEENQYNL